MSLPELMKQAEVSENAETLQRKVEVYFLITRIGEIDTMNEKFLAEIRIESSWKESERIDVYDPKKNWNPQLYIENALQLTKEDVSYKVSPVADSEETIITEVRKAKGFFWERLELNNFPLDLQELSVTLASSLDANEVRLLRSRTSISHIDLDGRHMFTDQQKWKLFKIVDVLDWASYDEESTSSLSEPNEPQTNKSSHHTPKIRATCYGARRPSYYFVNAYFLIFLITIMSLCTFAVAQNLPQNRLQLTFVLLLTSVSFKWVTNRSLPTISHLTSLDKYAITSISFLCLLCMWHAVGSHWTPKDANFWAFITFIIIFVAIQIWFIVWFFSAYSDIKKLNARQALQVNALEKTVFSI